MISFFCEPSMGDDGDGIIRDGWSHLRARAFGAALVDVIDRAMKRGG